MRAIVIVDHPGHILERIGVQWRKYGQIKHDVQFSAGVSNYDLCRITDGYDVVHWLDQLRYRFCARSIRRPQVLMIHHLTPSMLPELRPYLQYADALTTSSNRWQLRIRQELNQHALIIPYYVNPEDFSPCKARLAASAGEFSTQHSFVVGFIGKATADHEGRKGIPLMVEVITNLKAQIPKLSLLLVGPGWGPLSDQLRRSGINVIRQEFATAGETVASYGAMDCLLVTSNEEGGPCTILEAMACGKPFVTSDVGHVPELLSFGQSGIVCRERTPEHFVAALMWLNQNRNEAKRMGDRGRSAVLQFRSDTKQVPKIDFYALYHQATCRSKSRNKGSAKTLKLALSRYILLMRRSMRNIVGAQK
jgi:glycosyltransferase involved in cell wall biosynthesis